MSEPMSTHEIEDVLSSIRRLVSEDLRPAPRDERGLADAVPGADKPADKLLLTPALRVVGTPEAEVPTVGPDAPDTVATGLNTFSPPPSAPLDAGEVVTRLGSGVGEDDWESPLGDVEDWPDAGWAAAGSTSFASDAPVPGSDSAGVPRFIHRPRVSQGMPDTASEPAVDFIDAPETAFASHEDILPEDDFAAPGDGDAPVFNPPRRSVSPPGPGDAAWADRAEAEVMADLAQEVEDDVAAAGLFGDGDGNVMAFDEEVLRDLVRDLIREELSGTLGERITRNVRKLVRAEIARALAVREFD